MHSFRFADSAQHCCADALAFEVAMQGTILALSAIQMPTIYVATTDAENTDADRFQITSMH